MLGDTNLYSKDIHPTLIRTRVGMVFQRPNPFPTMSIYDNVVSGLRFNGIRKRSVLNEAAESALIAAALWDRVKDRLKAHASTLSGGEQQRLCIARALAVEPEVLLMDEPTSALDPISTQRIEELMSELKSRVTIIIVTHNMQQAARISDLCAFLLMGERRRGRADRGRPDREAVHRAGRPADARLHPRPVRLRLGRPVDARRGRARRRRAGRPVSSSRLEVRWRARARARAAPRRDRRRRSCARPCRSRARR